MDVNLVVANNKSVLWVEAVPQDVTVGVAMARDGTNKNALVSVSYPTTVDPFARHFMITAASMRYKPIVYLDKEDVQVVWNVPNSGPGVLHALDGGAFTNQFSAVPLDAMGLVSWASSHPKSRALFMDVYSVNKRFIVRLVPAATNSAAIKTHDCPLFEGDIVHEGVMNPFGPI